MRKIIRTANCPDCGSVKLKILPSNGEINYFCEECGIHVKTILCDEFTSISHKCDKCGKDIFKVKIEDNMDKPFWNPFCIGCNEQAKLISIDNEGNEFNFDKRQQVIIANSMSLFESRILKVSDKVYDFNEQVQNLKNHIKENSYKIIHINK